MRKELVDALGVHEDKLAAGVLPFFDNGDTVLIGSICARGGER